MVSFTTTFVAVIGFVSLAQPIVAAPLAVVAANAVGGLLSGGNKVRSDSALWARATKPDGSNEFKACINIMHTVKKPKVHKTGNVVDIENLDPVCIQDVKNYNGRKGAAAKQKKEGKATITGENSVRLEGMPKKIVDILDG